MHPDSDRLLVLQIDLGEEQRQLVAGIREHYSCEALVGRKIVIVANLQPAELRGKLSQGMLLAASKGKTLELVGTDAKVGTLVAPVGHDVLQDEITIDDFAKHKLLIHDKRLMCNGRILKARTGETVGADITDGAKVR